MDMKEIFESGCFSPCWNELDEEYESFLPQKKDITVLMAELEDIKNTIDEIDAKKWHLAKLMKFYKAGLSPK